MLIGEITTVIGIVISVITLIKAVREYIKQGILKRAEYFLRMRRELFADKDFLEVLAALDAGDAKVKQLDYAKKETYLGFLEEIAVLFNSDLIKIDIAYHMFGYFAIKCLDSKIFWADIEDKEYWKAVTEFADDMKLFKENKQLSKRIKL